MSLKTLTKILLRRLTAIFTILLAAFFISTILPRSIKAAPGDLDTTFGAGKVFTAMSSNTDYINAVAVQPDGKIVAVGALYNTSTANYDTAISRYNSDGSLDSSFAGDGTTYFAVNGSNHDNANAVSIDSNGKIVIAGQYVSGAGNWNTFVMRLNQDGTLNTTFGGSGIVTTDVSGGARDNLARAIALQSDGKIVVAGYSNNASTGNNFSVVRYTTSGAVDFVRLFDVSLISGVDEAYSVAVQSDGKIIAGGYAFTNSGGSGYDFALLRLNADGTVDSSYSGGVVFTNFNAQSDYIYSIALQSDGKLIAAGIGGDASRGNFGLARYNTNGTLDTTFGTNGKVTTNFTNNNSGIYGVKIQTDGKIVAAGYNENGSHNDFALARYNADGTLDTAFDTDGKVVSKISSFDNFASSAALQSDGKIVVAGRGFNNSTTGNDFAVARYNTNGSLDGTFAPNGKVTTAIGSGDDVGYSAALQSDGKVLVSGKYYVNTSIGWLCALVRYNSDGTLDTSFGTGGRVTQNYANNNFEETYRAVAVQMDGKIVAAGYYYDGSSYNFITSRFNSNGTLDTTFNSGGFIAKDFGSGINDFAGAVAIQTDGKIVVAGESGTGSLRNSAFVRYNTNGTLDTSFGSGGSLIVEVSSVDSDAIYSIVLQPDGKIIGVGGAYPVLGGIGHFSAVRLTASGALDNSFDSNGMLTTQIGSGTSIANSVTLQSDGKIVAAGYTQNGTNYNLALTRYNTDGSLDTSFDIDGKVTTTVSGINSYGYSVKIQADGKIVAAGQTAGAGNANDFLLARYNSNGSLDTTFDGDGLVIKDFGGFSDAANALVIQPDGKIVASGLANNGANNDFAVARFLPGADCTYSISPASVNVSAAASNGSVAVTPNETYCAWTVASNAAWLTVTGGASGTGSGTVNYSVAANTGGARTGTITVAGQTFTVNQAAAVDVSMPSNLQSLKNNTVIVPVLVSDTTGKGIISYDFRVSYDASVLTPLVPAFDKTGTLSSGFELNVNSGTAGQLLVSGYGTQALAGSGTLIYLRFTATGTAPACGSLGFAAFVFNDGSPVANTAGGQVCIVNGSVSGTVTNPNSANNLPVPNVTLSAAGNTAFATTTGANGDYLLEGFGAGNYTVTPAKTGGVNNAILSFDAALISRYSVQLETLSANQLLAADVSGSNTVNSYDAALISQYLVSIANPGVTGTWKFTPAARTYTDLTANQANQNYTAILMGDVSGNWTPTVSPLAEMSKAEQNLLESPVAVQLPRIAAGGNQTITVPVSVSDLSGRGFLSFDAAITFDPAVLQLEQAAPFDKNGTLSGDLSITGNPNQTGRISLSAYGKNSMQGSGALINLRFRVIGQAGQVSPLSFERFIFNENQAQSVTTDGQLTILAPTAANASVSGRVLTAGGRGISNARVYLTDSRGITRSANTSSFGYYRFDDIPTGAVYTITVISKKYAFAEPTRVLTVSEQLTDVDFVTLE